MWPFKKKRSCLELLDDAIRKHEDLKESLKEPIHAKCERCGKTDFKDNMEMEHIVKYEKFGDTGMLSYFDNHDKPYIAEKWKHKSCRRPKQ